MIKVTLQELVKIESKDDYLMFYNDNLVIDMEYGKFIVIEQIQKKHELIVGMTMEVIKYDDKLEVLLIPKQLHKKTNEMKVGMKLLKEGELRTIVKISESDYYRSLLLDDDTMFYVVRSIRFPIFSAYLTENTAKPSLSFDDLYERIARSKDKEAIDRLTTNKEIAKEKIVELESKIQTESENIVYLNQQLSKLKDNPHITDVVVNYSKAQDEGEQKNIWFNSCQKALECMQEWYYDEKSVALNDYEGDNTEITVTYKGEEYPIDFRICSEYSPFNDYLIEALLFERHPDLMEF